MRNVLALLAACLLGFAAVGWYLNWYQLSSTASSSGHQSVNIDINGVKIREDVKKVQKGIQETRQNLREKGNAEEESGHEEKTITQPVKVFPNE